MPNSAVPERKTGLSFALTSPDQAAPRAPVLLAPDASEPAFLAKARPLLLAFCAGLVLAGCAQQPAKKIRSAGKEYFPSSKYGPASPRMVADGRPIPRGGGVYLVGRPYTIAGKRYVPFEKSTAYSVTGTASWYGAAFHGRRTANGEIYDMDSVTAAHPTMPLPSYARVTNLKNGKSMIVRVNDRGPYHAGRVMDVSSRVAELLEFKNTGTGRIRLDYIGRAGLAGSDDARLVATLRSDGGLAQLEGYTPPDETMVAEAPAAPQAQPAPAPEPVAPKPEPVRPAPVAAIAPATPVQPKIETLEPEPVAPRGPVGNVPLPPSRPFDLGTIPGAATPISVRPAAGSAPALVPPAPIQRPGAAPLPPRRVSSTF